MGLRVNETFRSLQGEGQWTGTPSTFIRLQGCGVGCPWCDTKHTWAVAQEDKTSPQTAIMLNRSGEQRWANVSVTALVDLCRRNATRHVVLTGGEPMEQGLAPLIAALLDAGHSVQIETSGTVAQEVDPRAWLTVSPKINMPGGRPVLHGVVRKASEIKHPVAIERNVDELLALLDNVGPRNRASGGLVYVQPVAQARRALDICIDACYRYGWRLSAQVHKHLNLP